MDDQRYGLKYEFAQYTSEYYCKFHLIFALLWQFNLDKHVSLTIMHIENEPVIQRMIAQMDNTTEAQCTAIISVSLAHIFSRQ